MCAPGHRAPRSPAGLGASRRGALSRPGAGDGCRDGAIAIAGAPRAEVRLTWVQLAFAFACVLFIFLFFILVFYYFLRLFPKAGAERADPRRGFGCVGLGGFFSFFFIIFFYYYYFIFLLQKKKINPPKPQKLWEGAANFFFPRPAPLRSHSSPRFPLLRGDCRTSGAWPRGHNGPSPSRRGFSPQVAFGNSPETPWSLGSERLRLRQGVEGMRKAGSAPALEAELETFNSMELPLPTPPPPFSSPRRSLPGK